MRVSAATLLLSTPAFALPNNAPNSTSPLSLQMAYSIMTRQEGIYDPSLDSSGPLQAGFVQRTFTQLLHQYPNATVSPSLTSYIAHSADSLLSIFANTTSALRYSMDRLSTGNAFVAMAQTTGEEKYTHTAEVLRSTIDANERNSEAGLWYYVYPYWSYLDGMFSFGPFSALYSATYDPANATAWVDLRRQFDLLAEHCAYQGPGGEGLLVHGYDDSKTAVWANNSLGQSPHVWGRSLGWYVLGLLETLSVLDEHAGQTNSSAVLELRRDFEQEFQVRMQAIARAVDPVTGAWWQLLDQPGTEGNYIESSGSAMFTWAILAGVRQGYLPNSTDTSGVSNTTALSSNASYADVARRAYGYLTDTFVVHNGNSTLGWNGTVSVCSLNSTASYEYYTSRPILYDSVLGSAAFVGASLEMERLSC
jgi:rhamnogalacturonyl hydrolase YesR